MEDNCLAVAPSACVHGVYESLQHSFAGFHPTAVCPQSRFGGRKRRRRKVQSSDPATLLKAGKKPVSCRVGSLSDSQDLTPKM